MPTIHLTVQELAVVKQAVETFNDMSNDMALEDISINLYPRGEEITTITESQAKVLRDELNEALRQRETVVSVMAKIGSSINENGYSK